MSSKRALKQAKRNRRKTKERNKKTRETRYEVALMPKGLTKSYYCQNKDEWYLAHKPETKFMLPITLELADSLEEDETGVDVDTLASLIRKSIKDGKHEVEAEIVRGVVEAVNENEETVFVCKEDHSRPVALKIPAFTTDEEIFLYASELGLEPVNVAVLGATSVKSEVRVITSNNGSKWAFGYTSRDWEGEDGLSILVSPEDKDFEWVNKTFLIR